ncbi:MAG TPA: DUF4845 domain-containing protein [Pseudomonadales bacterium]|nr:DUF4845 domain-containing protein [Pseudomonadales bacterium]
MQSPRSRQSGFTMWEGALLFGVFGLLFTFLMKLGPHYIDDHSIGSTFEELHKQMQGKDMYDVSNETIKKSLGKFFEVDMISGDIQQQVEIQRGDGKVFLILDYEVRHPLIGNIDAVMKFSHKVDLAAPLEK